MLRRWRKEKSIADRGREGYDLDSVRLPQVLLGNRSSGNTAWMGVSGCVYSDVGRILTNCLSGAAATTTAARLDAVLLQVCPVSMTRARVQVHGAVAVVLGALVLIHDTHANGGAQRHTELGARLDLNAILLVARGCDCALSRTAAGHLGLDVGLAELHARRTAVNNAADGKAVRLAIAAWRVSSAGGRRCGRGRHVRGNTEVRSEC